MHITGNEENYIGGAEKSGHINYNNGVIWWNREHVIIELPKSGNPFHLLGNELHPGPCV